MSSSSSDRRRRKRRRRRRRRRKPLVMITLTMTILTATRRTIFSSLSYTGMKETSDIMKSYLTNIGYNESMSDNQ